ncbi:MAG: hypothetical protein HFJ75_10540 [Eggerthellaceae bacterium]|nr:hypothetical protein [Eggerthellaceae bacterium]
MRIVQVNSQATKATVGAGATGNQVIQVFAESSWGKYTLVTTTSSLFLFDSTTNKIVWRLAPDIS